MRGLAAAFFFLLAGVNGIAGAQTLRVCVPDATRPYSWREGGQARGFDVRVSELVAARLNRKLELVWFENRFDREGSAALDVNALLSADICDVVPGYALYGPSLGEPDKDVARTPDYPGAKPLRQRPWIKLGKLAPGVPYHAAPLTVIVGPKAGDKKIASLADLEGLRVGGSGASLGSTLLVRYRGGMLANDFVMIRTIDDPLAALEAGQFDATLVDVHSFDTYRVLRKPDTTLRPTGFMHALSFNLGFVALETKQSVLRAVDQVIGELSRSDALATAAKASGMTLVPPREPAIRPALSQESLRDFE